MEERERIIKEAQKLVVGEDGRHTTIPEQLEAGIPLRRLDVDPNTKVALFKAQEALWPKVKATFTGITPPEAHPFQPDDSVLIKRH